MVTLHIYIYLPSARATRLGSVSAPLMNVSNPTIP